jgi:hypothetical protein
MEAALLRRLSRWVKANVSVTILAEADGFGPVPASAGGLLPIDALATSGLERRNLGGGVLIVGGDSGLTDLHRSNVSPFKLIMQYLFATPESQETFGQHTQSAASADALDRRIRGIDGGE